LRQPIITPSLHDGGLIGAIHSNSANASVRWQRARARNVGAAAKLRDLQESDSAVLPVSPRRHTVSGTVSVQHQVSEPLPAELVYTRLHQSYNVIAEISNAPDTKREFISVSYQFARQSGR
jgi:hypothetical protein